jgi:hypothetical protein
MNHTRNITPMRSNSPVNPRMAELHEQIRLRAYQLFEQRGRKNGHDLDDWLKAEAEITRKWRTAVA